MIVVSRQNDDLQPNLEKEFLPSKTREQLKMLTNANLIIYETV